MVPRHGAECRYSHAENASIAHIQSRAYDQKIDAGANTKGPTTPKAVAVG